MQTMLSNGLAVVLGYITPLIYLNRGTINTPNSQLIFFAVIFISSVFLIIINDAGRRKNIEVKSWYIIFEILGILGFIYSGFVLYFIFAFRQGVGF